MICVHGYSVDYHTFCSLANVQYCFKNAAKKFLTFTLKEYQFKKSDIIRFQAFDNEGDMFLVIIGNQHGMGNLETDKDILILVVDLNEMVNCLEVLKEGE